ncbi:chromosomal replication initiator, DnaA [Shewanella sediminis HAW-EB3]|uniref:Chromosomal replication initiator, DnaA n=2 Tax=Shewanella TaxID=22 RepID=A8FW27_SHESH|nr:MULTISPECIES: DnaA inactivator Hda [Shewanella]ABV37050.1 chromosomal replication initiator, DnaA [Shewanella sediminis HAW-EB3]RTR39808.1 DnaA inactivator Hda [Shewanella canadensis]
MKSNSPLQLSLPVHLPDDETFNSYYPAAGNDELIQSLQACAEGRADRSVFLWGPVKSGRTHLMHAACAHANDLERSSFYLPLGIHASISPMLLEGLEQLDLICIDDVDAIAGHPLWEEAIFDLYNRVSEHDNCSLIVSASVSPNDSGFALPDLVSRMQWGLNYQLQPMADDEKLAALQRRAAMRGLQLPEDVGRFLLNRLARDLRTLFDVLDRLDKDSLVHQRKLTIPFVKEMLRL